MIKARSQNLSGIRGIVTETASAKFKDDNDDTAELRYLIELCTAKVRCDKSDWKCYLANVFSVIYLSYFPNIGVWKVMLILPLRIRMWLTVRQQPFVPL